MHHCFFAIFGEAMLFNITTTNKTLSPFAYQVSIHLKMKNLILITLLAIVANSAFCQTKPSTLDSAKAGTVNPATAFSMRYDQVFKRNTDGSFSPIKPVQINGEAVNSGVQIAPGASYGGVNVAAFEGHTLLVDTIKGVIVIRKFLK